MKTATNSDNNVDSTPVTAAKMAATTKVAKAKPGTKAPATTPVAETKTDWCDKPISAPQLGYLAKGFMLGGPLGFAAIVPGWDNTTEGEWKEIAGKAATMLGNLGVTQGHAKTAINSAKKAKGKPWGVRLERGLGYLFAGIEDENERQATIGEMLHAAAEVDDSVQPTTEPTTTAPVVKVAKGKVNVSQESLADREARAKRLIAEGLPMDLVTAIMAGS